MPLQMTRSVIGVVRDTRYGLDNLAPLLQFQDQLSYWSCLLRSSLRRLALLDNSGEESTAGGTEKYCYQLLRKQPLFASSTAY
jgi:hypothetical protein